MSVQSEKSDGQQLIITLELQPENLDEADLPEIAIVSAVGRDTIDSLRQDGYLVQHVPTGQRGGEFLVQVIPSMAHLVTAAWQQIEPNINDLAALVTIFGGIMPVTRYMVQAYKKRANNSKQLYQLMKITVEVDGKPIIFEAHDLEQAEAVLKLAQKFSIMHPEVAAKVTSHSKVKVKGHIPKQSRRKRR